MVAKLILSMDGVVLKEYPLNKERITIGRKEHNDIVIDNLAVSGEHAAIVTILQDSFLEDLDSTNGLDVNGIPMKKHFLQNNDVIGISKYKLKYISDHIASLARADIEKTVVMPPPKPAMQSPGVFSAGTGVHAPHAAQKPIPAGEAEKLGKSEPDQTAVTDGLAGAYMEPTSAAEPMAAAKPIGLGQEAVVQVLTGPNAGKEFDLVKNLTTLGKPGIQVAVLTRRPQGYFLTHVEGERFPLVNGQPLNHQPHPLKEHDVIELIGVKMKFYFRR